MNKRQRKKQCTRAMKPSRELRQLFVEIGRLAPPSPLEDGYNLIHHPRRQWLTTKEFYRKKAEFHALIKAEKAAIREKLKTHNYTLAGWRPKRPSELLSE